jgi:superfamily I DNA/RNA helicase
VFWDFENCSIPKGLKAHAIVRQITDCILKKDVQLSGIYAIGHTNQLAQGMAEELEESGVSLFNVTSLKDSAADMAIALEIFKTVHFNKSNHEIYLISGDRDFCKLINFLQSINYRVTLIYADSTSKVLLNSAREKLPWRTLLSSMLPLQTFADAIKEKGCTTTDSFAQANRGMSTNFDESSEYSDNKSLGTEYSNYLKFTSDESDVCPEPIYNFDELIEAFERFGRNSVPITHLGGVALGIHHRHNFPSFKSYLEAAESAGIVKIGRPGPFTGAVEVKLISKQITRRNDDFSLLREALRLKYKYGTTISTLGLNKNVWKDQFENLSSYLLHAEKHRVIRIFNRTDKDGNLFIKLNC